MASRNESTQKELQKTKSGLRILVRDERQISPFLLEEPPWIPDDQVHSCEKCGKRFDFVNRKHHCRRCGKIYCGNDTGNKAPLPRLSFVDPVRLCESCAAVTLKENEFFHKHIKALTNGAYFNVISTQNEHAGEEKQFFCKLSPSHRFIEFHSSLYNHEQIDLKLVNKVQILTSDTATGSVASGISIQYFEAGTEKAVTLRAKPDNSRKQAAAWIVAFQKGMKLIFEVKSSPTE